MCLRPGPTPSKTGMADMTFDEQFVALPGIVKRCLLGIHRVVIETTQDEKLAIEDYLQVIVDGGPDEDFPELDVLRTLAESVVLLVTGARLLAGPTDEVHHA